ncbi:MAG: 2-C-methyl-D-erythritol 4-phosphate cytidylyltransferase [Betaproteobacteria bacterium]
MTRAFAIIAAAGTGTRMGETIPKQYLPIRGHPLLSYSIAVLCSTPNIDRTYVVLHEADRMFATYDWQEFGDKLTPLYCGGATRAHSVLASLQTLEGELADDDWVLVHDAARPCLQQAMIERLFAELADETVGGLLAIPVADTLKREDGHRYVLQSEQRGGLWQAQTPQMFRFGLLLKAMSGADLSMTTDESSALEQLGYHPKLVMGSAANLKVTHAADLALAEMILQIAEK